MNSQLYYDIARDQWVAWSQRYKKWVALNRSSTAAADWLEHEWLGERVLFWREVAAPHHSASRYIVG